MSTSQCHKMQICHNFLATLGVSDIYFDKANDKCYCSACASTIPDIIKTDSRGSMYEVPKGWCGFGLKLPARAHDLNVFKEWVVTFHGCGPHVIPSIMQEGRLLMPGDILIDGSTLPNRATRGGPERIQVYTSPSIKYAELDIYAKPVSWQGHTARVVLQCRQKPNFDTCGETIAWKNRFGDASISKYFGNDCIEYMTRSKGSIIPYRILVALDVTTREMEEELKLNASCAQVPAARGGNVEAAKEVVDTIQAAIEKGVPIYNGGDPGGCAGPASEK